MLAASSAIPMGSRVGLGKARHVAVTDSETYGYNNWDSTPTECGNKVLEQARHARQEYARTHGARSSGTIRLRSTRLKWSQRQVG
eukprot:1920868-Amphidinium_carterae.2